MGVEGSRVTVFPTNVPVAPGTSASPASKLPGVDPLSSYKLTVPTSKLRAEPVRVTVIPYTVMSSPFGSKSNFTMPMSCWPLLTVGGAIPVPVTVNVLGLTPPWMVALSSTGGSGNPPPPGSTISASQLISVFESICAPTVLPSTALAEIS